MAKALLTGNVAPNLLNREFRSHGAKAVLLTDITYIPRKDGGFSYLSANLDAFTKQLLTYTVSDSLEVSFVLEPINKLVENYLQKKTQIHSDQGCHYTSCKFIQLVKDVELRR